MKNWNIYRWYNINIVTGFLTLFFSGCLKFYENAANFLRMNSVLHGLYFDVFVLSNAYSEKLPPVFYTSK